MEDLDLIGVDYLWQVSNDSYLLELSIYLYHEIMTFSTAKMHLLSKPVLYKRWLMLSTV